MPQHIATWNPTTQLWETDQIDLFSGRSEPFSATFPTSGMTRSGRLLPLPMSEPHTDVNGFSSSVAQMLPTRRATDGTKGGPNQRGSSGDLMLPSAVMNLE